MIEIRHLEKRYPDATPLKDVCAEIRDGEVISVIGPSGSGKSTLLRCINRLETPSSGQILVDGLDVTAPRCDLCAVRQKMGMVFQSFNLFGNMTVIENVMAAPVDLKKVPRSEAYREGMRLLREVGLAEKALRYPEELSGGQKQRAAIARALAMDPEILLLDEPTSALDPAMVGEVQAVVRKLAGMGKTMLIVTHEMAFARSICSRVFYLDEGVIYEQGPPEQIFGQPLHEKTRRFVRRLSVLELAVAAREYDFLGMMSRITEYGIKNRIPPRLTGHIQLVFEELVHNLLLPELAQPDILFTAEYSETEETAAVRVDYGEEALDPLERQKGLPPAVLRGIAREIRFTRTRDDSRPNRIELTLK